MPVNIRDLLQVVRRQGKDCADSMLTGLLRAGERFGGHRASLYDQIG